MGLFGIKKSKNNKDIDIKEQSQNTIIKNDVSNDSNTFHYTNDSTVLGPQPVINNIESNVALQNNTYNMNNVAPIGVTAPNQNVVNQTSQNNNIVNNNSSVVIPSVVTNNVETLDMNTNVESSGDNDIKQEQVVNASQLNALDNATNPVPVNPVAPIENNINYADQDVKIKNVINMFINSLTKPGTTMEEDGNKYRDSIVAWKVTLFITLISIVLSLISGIVSGCFNTGYNSNTGAAFTTFNPGNIVNVNWLSKIFISIMVSGISISIVSGVYYVFSFIKSKGIAFRRYMMVTNIAFVPFIFGVTVVAPIGSIISPFLGLALAGIGLIYTLVSFISGINNLLAINSVNKNIIYNVVNLGLIYVVIIFIVFKLFYGDIVNAIGLIH